MSPVVVVLPESGPGICIGGTSVGMGVSVSLVIVVVMLELALVVGIGIGCRHQHGLVSLRWQRGVRTQWCCHWGDISVGWSVIQVHW